MKEETQVASDSNWKRTQRRRFIQERVWIVKSIFHGMFWRVLFSLHINRPVARMMCRLNIYGQYTPKGRCHWCGEVHGIHWSIKEPSYGGIEKL